MPERTVLASLPAALLDAACAEGVDRAALLDASGLDPAALGDADCRVPFENHVRLMESVFRDPPPDRGLRIGARVGTRGLGVVGYAMEAGGTLGDALLLLQRFRTLVVEEAVPNVSIDATSLVLTQVHSPRIARLRGPAEAQAAAAVSAIRALAGAGLSPSLVEFPHPAPPDDRAHRAFFRCPLAWGAPLLRLTFPSSVLTTPLPRGHTGLFRYLTQRADTLHTGLDDAPDLLDRATRAILAALPRGEPEIAAIAKGLGLSTRSLQRRLSERSRTFAQVLDQVRRERALQLLDDDRLSITEVAYLVGYAEPGAFHRAFRRWTGSAPGQYRR